MFLTATVSSPRNHSFKCKVALEKEQGVRVFLLIPSLVLKPLTWCGRTGHVMTWLAFVEISHRNQIIIPRSCIFCIQKLNIIALQLNTIGWLKKFLWIFWSLLAEFLSIFPVITSNLQNTFLQRIYRDEYFASVSFFQHGFKMQAPSHTLWCFFFFFKKCFLQEIISSSRRSTYAEIISDVSTKTS